MCSNTCVQINLNTTLKTPTETNVSMFLYEAGTKKLKYSFIHTLNRYGNPDTLIIDALLKYDLVVNTLPKIEQKNIIITKFKQLNHLQNIKNIDSKTNYEKYVSA